MSVLREEGQACTQKKVMSVVVSKADQAPEGEHLHLLRGQRWSVREREERGEGFGDHETRETGTSRGSQQTGEHDRDG